MTIEHLILARDSSIDRDKNTISLFDLIEDIRVQTAADRIPLSIQVIAVIRREAETGQVDDVARLVVTAPSGAIALNSEVPFRIEGEHRRVRIRIHVSMAIGESGDYHFELVGKGFKKDLLLGVALDRPEQG